MEIKLIFLIIFVLNLHTNICLTITPKIEPNYTYAITYDINIGKNKHKMIVNTLSKDNILYSNTNRPFGKELHLTRNKNIYNTSIFLSEIKLENFSFKVKLDESGIGDRKIQGELGLGLPKESENVLMQAYSKKGNISRLNALFEDEEVKFGIGNINKYNFTYCSVSDKGDIRLNYTDSWICDMSHLFQGNITLKNPNDAIEINARVIFNSISRYFSVPYAYYNTIRDLWELNGTACELIDDKKYGDYLSCDLKYKSDILLLSPIYLVIAGTGYKISPKDLFEEDDKRFVSLIRFIKVNNNIWSIGKPFFDRYKILLDFNNQRVGISGEYTANFSVLYKNWLENNPFRDTLNEIKKEKVLMLIGLILGCLIILLVLYFAFKGRQPEKNNIHNKFFEENDNANISGKGTK